ncbi:uncharacterized protein LOC125045932 [Penaeus chinensis]|uniref:uncharacterized protein LOC125045932 n=1 Tax=Penaeus chinensis TaxID=139456 RepID=UPI001FB6600E|nr:uncharacterized protein LOC125045932 [Penaeus chinensis]
MLLVGTVEVAFQLVDIFLLMGAPAVLQSDNGSEFTSRVIAELKEMWPSLTMVHGKPRHPQSQGSVERANSDSKDIYVRRSYNNNKFAASSTGSVTTSEATTSDNNDLLAIEVTEALSVDAIVQTPQILQDHQDQIQKRRVEAYRGQVSQAERTVKRCRLDFKVGEPGDHVAVPIPAVDRGRGDPRTILGVIVSRDLDNDQYKIAVELGVLKVSLREAVIAQSACGGQGFTRCNCSGLKKCSTNRLWFSYIFQHPNDTSS